MTNCYNCGHTGTFVLLVQHALSVPGPGGSRSGTAKNSSGTADGRSGTAVSDPERFRPETAGRGESSDADGLSPDADGLSSDADGLSLAVQCPACDSTDVAVAAEDLLARYRSSTTS